MCLIFHRIGLPPKYMRPQVVDLPLDTCSVVTNPEIVLSLRFVVGLDINQIELYLFSIYDFNHGMA